MKNFFSFFIKRTPENPLKTDFHSHLVPGIDDGSKNIEESIWLIQELKHLGYTKLITTPHTMQKRFPNSKKKILKEFNYLKNQVAKRHIKINLEIASEYYLDDNFIELIKKKDLLCIKDFVLFECSFLIKPLNLLSSIKLMQDSGYKPILAHPERYPYMFDENLSFYKNLKNQGVYFQANINSLNGYYSKKAQFILQKLAQNHMIDFLGSDTHKLRHIQCLKKVFLNKSYQQIFKTNTILNDIL